MIILDTKQFHQSSKITLEEFKKLVYNNYYTLKENDSDLILVIEKLFSDKEIRKAINDLSLDKNRNIVIDNHIRSNIILRYLEFGGEGLRAPHLLSNSKKSIERRILDV